MVRVTIKLPGRIKREYLPLLALLAASALFLALGLPRIALVPRFGVTWNLVPGLVLLLVAGLRYGREWSREEPPEPVVGYMALMVGLPALTALLAYGSLAQHGTVGSDMTLLARLAAGEQVSLGMLPRLVLATMGPSTSALLRASLAVHALNAALVGLLALKLARNRGIALLAAVLFAAYPLNVEAVAWLHGERLLEGSFFLLVSLLLATLSFPRRRPRVEADARKLGPAQRARARDDHRRERRRALLGNAAYLTSLLCFAAALPLTPIALALPLAVLLLDLRDQHELHGGLSAAGLVPALGRSVGHFGVLLAALSLGWADRGGMPGEPVAGPWETALNLLAFPRDLIVPLSSAWYGTQSLLILVGVVLTLELLLMALVRRRPDTPTLMFTLLLIGVLALPALPHLTPDESPSGSRFLYLAGAAFVILGSVYLRAALGRDRSSGGWLIVMLALLVSVGCLRSNLRLWRQNGRLTVAVVSALAAAGQRLPEGGSIVLLDWPRVVDGVPFASADDLQAALDLRRRLTGGTRVRIKSVEPTTPNGPTIWYRWSDERRWMREERPPGSEIPSLPATGGAR